MDKKSKILIALLMTASLASIALSYYRTIVRRDFTVTVPDAGATDAEAGTSTIQ